MARRGSHAYTEQQLRELNRTRARPMLPAAPILGIPPALTRFFAALQESVLAEGWQGTYTYNASGNEAGLHAVLVREHVLFVEVPIPGQDLSPGQEAWRVALTQARQEVAIWAADDLGPMQARLRQPQAAEVVTVV